MLYRLLSLASLLVICSSHELFLKSNSYFIQPEQPTQLFLFNGTFDESENTITRDRIINAQVIGPDYTYQPKTEDYYDEGNITVLRFPTGASGTYTTGISTLPRTIELDAQSFSEYLEHEGLTALAKQRQEQGIANQPARETYSKHVKAILQAGDSTSEHFRTPMGYPIEFIPLENPYQKTVGETISFQLFLKGAPLSNQQVHFSSSTNGKAKTRTERSVRTDAEGRFQVPLDQAGHWYVATIFIEESKEANVDYESNWATLTFEVR
jgi:hypothetical protein